MNRKMGIIGIGNVGSMLLNKFIEHNLLHEKNIYVANRSKEILKSVKEKFPSINICHDNIEVVKNCDDLLLCVEPLNIPDVLLEIQPYMNENIYLMVSTSMVAIEDIYKFHKGSITIFMPTLISMVNEGVTLACHNNHVNSNEKNFFNNMMGCFSKIKILDEQDIAVSQNLTASFPGFFAEIMLEFVRAVSKRSNNVSDEELEYMLLESLLGASKLLIEKNMSFEETINRVSTKGGITFEGVKVFKEKLPEVFEAALDASTMRYREIAKAASINIR